jgi:hypothetical protein
VQRMRAAGRAEATPQVAKAKEDEKASRHQVGDLFRAKYLRYEAQIKAIDVVAGPLALTQRDTPICRYHVEGPPTASSARRRRRRGRSISISAPSWTMKQASVSSVDQGRGSGVPALFLQLGAFMRRSSAAFVIGVG